MRPTLGRQVGQALRMIREELGKTQDDVARAARRAGIPWTRAGVAALERGSGRGLELDELARVPVLLHELTGDVYTVDLHADGNEGARVDIRGPAGRSPWRVENREMTPWFRTSFEGIRENERALRIWPEATREVLEAAHVERGGDAEAKAARRLRVSTLTVALAARKTWQQSLSAERDRRVSAETSAEARPRTLQALRGHVTRALLAELEPVVRAAGPPRRR